VSSFPNIYVSLKKNSEHQKLLNLVDILQSYSEEEHVSWDTLYFQPTAKHMLVVYMPKLGKLNYILQSTVW